MGEFRRCGLNRMDLYRCVPSLRRSAICVDLMQLEPPAATPLRASRRCVCGRNHDRETSWHPRTATRKYTPRRCREWWRLFWASRRGARRTRAPWVVPRSRGPGHPDYGATADTPSCPGRASIPNRPSPVGHPASQVEGTNSAITDCPRSGRSARSTWWPPSVKFGAPSTHVSSRDSMDCVTARGRSPVALIPWSCTTAGACCTSASRPSTRTS
jgi:hypothetical protein